MAIPVGTTARQLASIARWMLAGVVVFGMLMWWWPGFRAWGAMTSGLLVIWMLWLLWRIVADERTVPGHVLHVALVGPVAILACHLVADGLSGGSGQSSLHGALDASMIFHVALISLGVMLAQSLLSEAAWLDGLLSICALAMMGGTAAAITWGRPGVVRSSVTLLGFAGVGVWLTPLWRARLAARAQARPADDRRGETRHAEEVGLIPSPTRSMRLARLFVAAAAAAILCAAGPAEAMLAAGVVGMVLIVAAVVFPGHRVVRLAIGVALLGVAIVCISLPGVEILWPSIGPAGAVGMGEQAFADLGAGSSGATILARTVGWLGLGWMAAVMAAGAGRMLIAARKESGVHMGRMLTWTAATGVATLSFLAPGGLFVPAASLALVLTWGMLPAMLGWRCKARSGYVLLGALGCMLVLLGLAVGQGLVTWVAFSFAGSGDKVLHALTGFFLAMVMAWLWGSRRFWLGMLGIVAAALAGGVAEGLQGLVSSRNTDMADWLGHAIGCAAAIGPYALCLASRWCESADAGAIKADAYERYVSP